MSAIPAVGLPDEVYYPESDGKPLGETPLHRDELTDLVFRLRRHFASEPSVYVSGNMMMYYEEGNPRASVSPDVFVAMGAGERYRRIYKIWEEACGPTVVIEVSSLSTAREDRGRKKDLYARLGVAEYWLYDPEGEYLEPRLQGFRRVGQRYQPIRPREDGAVESTTLGLRLQLIDGSLELYDGASGERLPRPYDLARERDAAEAVAAAAERAREAAEAEVARLEAEVERLQRGSPS